VENKPILNSLLIVVSETVIELDDPDGHELDHPPEMTVHALGSPAVPIMLAMAGPPAQCEANKQPNEVWWECLLLCIFIHALRYGLPCHCTAGSNSFALVTAPVAFAE
jgi:hypothetical protein